MLTRRDPWNNILRGTLACFGAGVGGADAITTIPFDAAIGQPDRLARRIARNTQALLVEESHVARVIDPAGGSWYVEDLTEQLALRAWTCLRDLEQAVACSPPSAAARSQSSSQPAARRVTTRWPTGTRR